MRSSLLLTVAAASLLAAASSAVAAGTWVAAVPVSGSSSTLVFGINDHNIVTGEYVDSSGHAHGFVGPFDGTNYTSFDDPGGSTEARALNDRNDITGYDLSTLIPWERFSNGTLQNVTKAGSDLSQIAQGINRTGTFAGNYTDVKGYSRGYTGRRAKFRAKIDLSLANLGYAGRAIDEAGDVAGWYYDPTTGAQRGYLIMGGTVTKIDFPGSSTVYTVVEGLNNHGIVSGQWDDSSGVIHGFVYDASTGKYTSLDAPGASFTQVWGINDADVVTASAATTSGTQSFVYCMKAAGCPAPGRVVKTSPPVSGKPPVPAAP
ncbi:MAG TPA: hypothetical protein VHT03_00935 [Rhizomicrobium sp.]|jgi:hypothetical protein|nr:hypothetical protein [Rhizomicrobium sp.]